MTRDGCCATWPKPCSYHEGFGDCTDLLGDLAGAARHALDACESGERGETWWHELADALDAFDAGTGRP